MKFRETKVAGAYVIDVDRISDDRGFFGRIWCSKEFGDQSLTRRIEQINVGFSPKQGTLRGMHYQVAPFLEVKVVRCTRGAVYDVVVDLRSESPTFGKWDAAELTQDNLSMMYVPEGCAHGYLTLTPDSEIYYIASEVYAPDQARGIRYDDPMFGVEWPAPVTVISDGDRNWPDFQPDGSD